MTYPLSLTGEYVEGEFDPETGETGPAYVLIRVNGVEAVHLMSDRGWLAPSEQQYEIQDQFIELLRKVIRRG